MNLNRSSFFTLVCLIATFTFAPSLRADIPLGQVKAAGATTWRSPEDKIVAANAAFVAANKARAEAVSGTFLSQGL